MKDEYTLLAQGIVKQQEKIVGPLAWSEANKVSGIQVSDKQVTVSGNGKQVLESLVKQYENLFGQASIEACKDAIRPLLPKMKKVDLPANLQ